MKDSGQTRFVVFEGLDGAGTTTQASLLADALKGRDLRVYPTAEPTEGPLGAVCRAHVRRELTLDTVTASLAFTADRADHLERVIRPALREGAWVVCDRYVLSTLAYQGAEGADPEWLWALQARFEVPSLTVFLDVPPEIGHSRRSGRPSVDRYEESAAQDDLRASYLRWIERLNARGDRVVVLDGSPVAESVSESVLREVDKLG